MQRRNSTGHGLLLLLATALLAGCIKVEQRKGCAGDGDCYVGQVCRSGVCQEGGGSADAGPGDPGPGDPGPGPRPDTGPPPNDSGIVQPGYHALLFGITEMNLRATGLGQYIDVGVCGSTGPVGSTEVDLGGKNVRLSPACDRGMLVRFICVDGGGVDLQGVCQTWRALLLATDKSQIPPIWLVDVSDDIPDGDGFNLVFVSDEISGVPDFPGSSVRVRLDRFEEVLMDETIPVFTPRAAWFGVSNYEDNDNGPLARDRTACVAVGDAGEVTVGMGDTVEAFPDLSTFWETFADGRAQKGKMEQDEGNTLCGNRADVSYRLVKNPNVVIVQPQ